MESTIENKKARFDYEILDSFEAGIVLSGSEVKAIKTGKASLVGAHVKVYQEELWLVGATISPYQEKNTTPDYDPARSRKLLAHKEEIKKLIGKTTEQGLTLIPLAFLTRRNRVKAVIGLAKSKKAHDKRETIKKRETNREIRRQLKR